MATPLDYGAAANPRNSPSLAAWAKATGDAVGIVDTAWKIPTLLNGWVNYGSPFLGARYRKAPGGLVIVEGLVMNGTTSAAIFILPAGYRPAGSLIFACIGGGAVGRVDVAGDGSVLHSIGGTGYFSICFSFYADA